MVQREKISDYLLNAAHPDNNGKAEFFETFGFHLDDWETLAKAMRQMALSGEVITSLETAHGLNSRRCDGNSVRQIAESADGLDR